MNILAIFDMENYTLRQATYKPGNQKVISSLEIGDLHFYYLSYQNDSHESAY